MRGKHLSRRDVLQTSLKGSTALAIGGVFASPARAEPPPAVAITPQLVDAAKKEGTVVLYSSMDLPVGEKLGIRFRIPIEKRIAGGEAVGAHKTSMLQDVEAGRMLEADALLGSVIELARLVELPTPHLDSVYALVKLLDHELQTAHGRLRIASP